MNCISTCVFLCFLLLLHDMNKGHYPPEYSWQRCSRTVLANSQSFRSNPETRDAFGPWGLQSLGFWGLGVLGPWGLCGSPPWVTIWVMWSNNNYKSNNRTNDSDKTGSDLPNIFAYRIIHEIIVGPLIWFKVYA